MPAVPRIRCFAPTLLALLATPLAAQQVPGRGANVAAPVPPPPYALVADLVLRSPLVIDSVIRNVARLGREQAVGVPAGKVRVYVEADVRALVRGSAVLPARIGWVLDLTPDAKGRLPKLAKQRVMVFARPIAGYPAQVQLTGGDAQQVWTPALDARTRTIIRETLAADAPPRITGIGNAFHVPGSLPGEGETQIFLQTENGRPVSLNILRRPGEQPRWAVALSEIVDEAAAPPPPDTLLRYRLACGLPADLPDRAIAAMEDADRRQARADYAFVLKALGPCIRAAA